MLQLRNALPTQRRLRVLPLRAHNRGSPTPARTPPMPDPTPDLPPDRIHLRDYLIEAEIGAFAAEHGSRQRLRFTLEAGLSRRSAGAGDDVDRVLSYDILVAAVQGGLAERRFDLLEALAEDIAARVLAHSGVAVVAVTVEKLDRVPGALGVSITRSAGGQGRAGRGKAAPALPVLGPGVPDALPQGGAVIVPDAPGLPLPDGGDPAQLALLALDQQAWAIAARLGLGVAASRTELEAAAVAGVAVVWAPARMVREAKDLAPGQRGDPAELARWLTKRFSPDA